MLLSNPNFAI